MALTGDLPPRPDGSPGSATAAVMEMSASGALATVCSYIDGAASLYLSTGGGVIGTGNDPRVNVASRAFIAAVEESIGSLAPADASPELGAGRVRFLLRIGDDLWGAEALERELIGGQHPLSPLWAAGQHLLTGIRVVAEEQQRR